MKNPAFRGFKSNRREGGGGFSRVKQEATPYMDNLVVRCRR